MSTDKGNKYNIHARSKNYKEGDSRLNLDLLTILYSSCISCCRKKLTFNTHMHYLAWECHKEMSIQILPHVMLVLARNQLYLLWKQHFGSCEDGIKRPPWYTCGWAFILVTGNTKLSAFRWGGAVEEWLGRPFCFFGFLGLGTYFALGLSSKAKVLTSTGRGAPFKEPLSRNSSALKFLRSVPLISLQSSRSSIRKLPLGGVTTLKKMHPPKPPISHMFLIWSPRYFVDS